MPGMVAKVRTTIGLRFELHDIILVLPRHSKCVQKKERDRAKKTSPSSEVVKSGLAGRSYNSKSGYVR